MKKNGFFAFAVFSILVYLAGCTSEKEKGLPVSFNDDWLFCRQDSAVTEDNMPSANAVWRKVTLPHTANIEAPDAKGEQWTGLCWYKKSFRADRKFRGKHVGLLFDGAMNDAIVYLNGIELSHNTGGYLPFYVDLSKDIKAGRENELLVKLDNRNKTGLQPGDGPGFLTYGGIYRDVSLIIKDRLHITNAMEIAAPHGGGLMAGVANVTADQADVNTAVVVRNDDKILRIFSLRTLLVDAAGNKVAETTVKNINLMPGTLTTVRSKLVVAKPSLWSPDKPFLYTLLTEIIEGETVIDSDEQRIGIRDLKITADNGVSLNGIKIKITGTNRYQEYPELGFALSDNASYRDAYKIKEAGFNFVRCAGYPQSPAFLNACDELGIMVMDVIPGWQFIGDSVFREETLKDAQLMCRRDRNHPSVILWGLSPDGTNMSDSFLSVLHKSAHAELNMIQCYTASSMDTVCDVFTPALKQVLSQWSGEYSGSHRPMLICRYGDNEYTGNNNGSDKPSFNGSDPASRKADQMRNTGERSMLRQAYGFMAAHNNNLAGPAFGDANWLMCDYNRDDIRGIESSGVMSIFRLPKFSYWFYRSQSDRSPVCFIASYNTPSSGKTLRVFSNADSVFLYGDGRLIAKAAPDINRNTINLPHPPFTFLLTGHYRSLSARGIKKGEAIASSTVTEASKPAALRLSADLSNRPLSADGADAVFVYASVVDSTDNVVYSASDTVTFSVKGNATIIGPDNVMAKSGVAAVLIQAGLKPGKIIVRANSGKLSRAEIMVESKKQED